MMDTTERMPHFRKSRVIQVIETEVYDGEETEKSPGRIFKYYSNLNGDVLAIQDEWLENRKEGKFQST